MAYYRDMCWPGDNLQTALTVAKECTMISPLLRIIQVEASLIAATMQRGTHLQIFYKNPLSAPEFFNPFNRSVRCFFINHLMHVT